MVGSNKSLQPMLPYRRQAFSKAASAPGTAMEPAPIMVVIPPP
jgi:hypothetical protein